jgi:DNA-binding transcriptional MocR family regulator
VTIGADHTDRKVESYSVAVSKQVCPKPIGRAAWRFEDIEPHWDRLMLRSFVIEAGHKALYQQGPLAGIRPLRDLIAAWNDGSKRPPAGVAMFCGTMGALGGIRPSPRFDMELEDPVLGRKLVHGYEVEVLPLVS